ncbi:hypothetical protein FQR65_LT19669 [Abscondita terminalis]|nr:hypothetical protein FQR65_LT19669 [Abscondita terminalis]
MLNEHVPVRATLGQLLNSNVKAKDNIYLCSTCGEQVGTTTGDCNRHICMAGADTIWIVENMVYPYDPMLDNTEEQDVSTAVTYGDITQDMGAQSPNAEVEEGEGSQQHRTSAATFWTRQAKQLLIDLYPKYLALFAKRAILSKEKMFAKIAEEMKMWGYAYTAEQIKNRWRCFEKAYKSYIQNTKATGRGRKTLDFEVELHAIFHKEPRFVPEVITSSVRTVVKSAPTTTTSEQTVVQSAPTRTSIDDVPPLCERRRRCSSTTSNDT